MQLREHAAYHSSEITALAIHFFILSGEHKVATKNYTVQSNIPFTWAESTKQKTAQ